MKTKLRIIDWIESIFISILNQYFRYWIASIFDVLDWINIPGIGLNQYFRYWIESIFDVLDWINILGIGLNQYSRYWIESWKLKDWIEPKILFTIGLNAFYYLYLYLHFSVKCIKLCDSDTQVRILDQACFMNFIFVCLLQLDSSADFQIYCYHEERFKVQYQLD